MIIKATAKIVPGKKTNRVKRVKAESANPLLHPQPQNRSRKWIPDPTINRGKRKPKEEHGVTVCIHLTPPQLYTDFYLFARKMGMNHSQLVRTALREMMERHGWKTKEVDNGPTP